MRQDTIVANKPKSVREINSWLKRMGVNSRMRVRTVKGQLALQERVGMTNNWRIVRLSAIDNFDNLLAYLVQYVPVDWQY